MFRHHIAIRNNKNRKEHSIQAPTEVALKVEIRKKDEEVIKRKVCQRGRILYDLKESHEQGIIVPLNIILLEIAIKGRKRQKLWKGSPKVKLKMDSVGLHF